jgi:hypothetical protein
MKLWNSNFCEFHYKIKIIVGQPASRIRKILIGGYDERWLGYASNPPFYDVMFLVSHKKSYLECVELMNFWIFLQPIPIFFSKVQNWDSQQRAPTAAISNFEISSNLTIHSTYPIAWWHARNIRLHRPAKRLKTLLQVECKSIENSYNLCHC